MIFKAVREGKPYPEHGLSTKEWARIPPRPVRLDQMVTIKRHLALDRLLAEDSTFYGDLFPHVVEWEGSLYLEDGLHRALRAALQQRTSIHARVLVLPLAATATGQATVVAAPGEVPPGPPG
ncbi:MAG: type II toxin-antitoxin system VapB family antitoxin [Micromonosporaceae bacterium]